MKKFYLLIITFLVSFVFIPNVLASTNVFERTESNKYGVNKKWDINEKNISNVKNTKYVDAKEKIYDFSNILESREEEILLEKINKFISNTGMDFVILTDRLSYYNDKQNEVYATDFYDYNDFGIDFEHYSGVLLFRNTYESDPYYNLYTFGEAQLYFTYNRLENILDHIYDDFVKHNYLDGMTKMLNYFNDYYKSGIPSSHKNYYIDSMGFIKKKYVPPVFIGILISGIITAIVMVILVNKNKMVKIATKADEYLDSSTINYRVQEDRFSHSRTTSYRISSSSGSGGGGSHSSGGSSGGGHSSGGGRHG